MKHLSYFRCYHRGCDIGKYFHRRVLNSPHCFCSFNMYLKLINFSKTCLRKLRRRLFMSDSNFVPLKLSVIRQQEWSKRETRPSVFLRYVEIINWIKLTVWVFMKRCCRRENPVNLWSRFLTTSWKLVLKLLEKTVANKFPENAQEWPHKVASQDNSFKAGERMRKSSGFREDAGEKKIRGFWLDWKNCVASKIKDF